MLLSIMCLLVMLAVIFFASHASQSRRTGWRALAQTYRYPDKFCGEKWYFRDVGFHRKFCYWDGYGLTLIIGANSEGLYLAQVFPFQFAHPALLVPWSDVRSVNYRNRRISQTPCLVLGKRKRVRIKISARLAEIIGKCELTGRLTNGWSGHAGSSSLIVGGNR
jgi:hypothetical protein